MKMSLMDIVLERYWVKTVFWLEKALNSGIFQ